MIDNKTNNKYNYIMSVIIIIAFYMFTFCPTSTNGIIFDVSHTLLIWSISIIVTIAIGILNRIKLEYLILELVILNIYMLMVTLMAQNKYDSSRISLARIAPIIVLTYATFIQVKNYPKYKLMVALLHFFCLSAIIINVGILIKNSYILNIMANNYNQYYDQVAYYSFIFGNKPVMTFGVHTYASYFYFIFYILSYYTYEKTSKNIFLIYCIFFCIFCFFLISTTAIIYFVVMLFFLLYQFSKKLSKSKLLFILIIIYGFFAFLIIFFPNISQKLLVNFTNGNNSFISRYSSSSVFTLNFKIILSSFGIGYNIVDSLNIGYSDSGYIVYMTMGNLPLTIFLYRRLYIMLNNNLPVAYRKMIIFIIFSFEIALPATFNYRFLFMIYFVICYLNSLSQYDGKRLLE